MQGEFTSRVYEIVGQIPAGRVATYGQIARLAGNPRAVRAVGMAMRRNTDTRAVPCHRVVAHDGSLTGYAFGEGVQTKRALLIAEGVAFRGERVDMSVSQWRPRSTIV